MKGLEALRYIIENERFYEPICQEENDKRYKIIQIIEKELKAWEIVKKHLSIVVPINDIIEIFDIDLWNEGEQKEDFKFVKGVLDL